MVWFAGISGQAQTPFIQSVKSEHDWRIPVYGPPAGDPFVEKEVLVNGRDAVQRGQDFLVKFNLSGGFFSPQSANLTNGVLIGVILSGLVLRFIYPFWTNPLDFLFSDMRTLWLASRDDSDTAFMYLRIPILYEWYLSFIRWISGDSRTFIAFSTAMMSVLTPFFYWRAARSLNFSVTKALFVFALITWTPSFFGIFTYFVNETLLLTMTGLALWMSGRHLKYGGVFNFAVASVCWTLASMTKASIVPVAGVALFYTWLVHDRKFKSAAIGLVIGVLLLTPNAVRTYKAFGFMAPLGFSTSVAIEHMSGARTLRLNWKDRVWVNSTPSAYMRPLEPFSGWMMDRAGKQDVYELNIDASKGKADWDRAYNEVNYNFGIWAKQQWENTILLFFAPSWPDGDKSTLPGLLQYWSRYMWAPIIIFVLYGNARLLLEKKFPLLPMLTTLFFFFLLFQPWATMEGRYRKPLEPLLLMNAVFLSGRRKQATATV